MSVQDVTQIVKSEIDIALKENSLVAEAVARKRLNEFSEIFLPKLVKSNLIECFSEPAIQVFFRNTEKQQYVLIVVIAMKYFQKY